jgi:hypothetical protein
VTHFRMCLSVGLKSVLTLTMLLAGGGAALSRTSSSSRNNDSGKSAVQVVDPMGSDPVLKGDVAARNPLWQHHVVFSPSQGGTTRFELGYNNYLKGFKVSSPYAFKNSDGLCFFPTGEIELSSDGVTVKTAPRTVGWRPAGAMTEKVMVNQDTITICGISPVRDENNKAQLGKAELERWSGDMALQPRMHYYAVDFIPLEKVGEANGDSIGQRRLVSHHKDGATKMELTNFILKSGAKVRNPQAQGEQACWLESGQLELLSVGKTLPVKTRNFFYRPEGVVIDELHALEDSSLVCWTSPALS